MNLYEILKEDRDTGNHREATFVGLIQAVQAVERLLSNSFLTIPYTSF
jgi:hypothetical protein